MANNSGSGDPAEPASWNRYAYVIGDPINYIDSSGQFYGPAGPDPDPTPSPSPDPSPRRDRPEPEGDPNPEPPPQALPANRDLLNAAVSRAKKALSENADCQKLFGNEKTRANGFDPSGILDQIAAGTFGTLTFEDKGANWGVASVSPNGVPKLSTVTITINSYNDGQRTWWNGGYVDYNAETLLHELGHVYDLTKGSGNSVLKSPDSIPIVGGNRGAWNDWKVDQDCFHGALGFKKP